MVGYVISCIGLALLVFVVFVRILDKCYRRYIVHWEDVEGNRSYSIVMACGKKNACRKTLKLIRMDVNLKLTSAKVTKVVRYR